MKPLTPEMKTVINNVIARYDIKDEKSKLLLEEELTSLLTKNPSLEQYPRAYAIFLPYFLKNAPEHELSMFNNECRTLINQLKLDKFVNEVEKILKEEKIDNNDKAFLTKLVNTIKDPNLKPEEKEKQCNELIQQLKNTNVANKLQETLKDDRLEKELEKQLRENIKLLRDPTTIPKEKEQAFKIVITIYILLKEKDVTLLQDFSEKITPKPEADKLPSPSPTQTNQKNELSDEDKISLAFYSVTSTGGLATGEAPIAPSMGIEIPSVVMQVWQHVWENNNPATAQQPIEQQTTEETERTTLYTTPRLDPPGTPKS